MRSDVHFLKRIHNLLCEKRHGKRKNEVKGASLAVQWLGLCTSTVAGTGLIPGQGTNNPCAVQHSQKNNKFN